MEPGFFCRSLADYSCKVEINLRPNAYRPPPENPYDPNTPQGAAMAKTLAAEEAAATAQEVGGQFETVPAAPRIQSIKELNAADPRPNAVCTVQTFRNLQTGE